MRFLKHSGTERPRRAGHRQWLPMVVGAAMLLAFVAPAADELLRGNAFAEEVLVGVLADKPGQFAKEIVHLRFDPHEVRMHSVVNRNGFATLAGCLPAAAVKGAQGT